MKAIFQRLIPAGCLRRCISLRQWFADRSLPALLATAAGFFGVVFLTLGAFLPWFLVAEFVPAGAPFEGSVRGIEPGVTWIFRLLCLAVIGVAGGVKLRLFRASSTTSLALPAALLLTLLLYPIAVLHTSPGLAARTAWLWNQHDQLTGYAGDIYTSQEVRDATWQQRILVVNEPLDNRIFKLPTWSPANLEWGRFFEITEWFGLSAWFSQALSRGWVLAVAGTLLLLLARGREREFAEPGYIRRAVPVSLAVTFSVLACAALPFFTAAHFLTRARDLVRAGDYHAALTALDRAAAVLPAVREDGAFFLQVGRLESELNLPTPAAEFYRAFRLARDGYTQQAEAAMLAALANAEPRSVWQRELVKGLLARAISELNSGQASPAIALLETVLAADPCNLKANYVLQIACARAGRPEELQLLVTRLKQTYRFLNTPTKRSVLASGQELLAAAELQRDRPTPALAHLRNSKRLPK